MHRKVHRIASNLSFSAVSMHRTREEATLRGWGRALYCLILPLAPNDAAMVLAAAPRGDLRGIESSLPLPALSSPAGPESFRILPPCRPEEPPGRDR